MGEGTTMEMVVIIMERGVTIMEMGVITMEMEASIMEETEASIMEEMVAGTMVTVMVVIIMEEMEDITMEMVAGTMVSVTVDVQIPTMEVVADQTQIMEMDGTMAIIMVVQILDNKSKNIKLIFRQLRPKTLNPQNDEVVCQTSILLSDNTPLTMILHFTL